MPTKSRETSLKINPYLSEFKSDGSHSYFSLHGRIKRLGIRHPRGIRGWFEEYTRSLSHREIRPEEKALADRLLEAGILVREEVVHQIANGPFSEARIVGRGCIAELAEECLATRYPSLAVQFVEKYPDEMPAERSVTLVCLDTATRDDLSRCNHAGLQGGQPYGFIYYNGKELLAGPVVVPGKTPCLGCLTTWLQKTLDKRFDLNLTGEEAGRAVASLPFTGDRHAALRAVRLVLDQMVCLFEDGSNDLAGVQVKLPLLPLPETHKTRFAYISDCPDCYGGLAAPLCKDPEHFLPARTAQLKMNKVPTCRLDNGYRAMGTTEARRMVDDAIERIGGVMRINELKNGPLDEVLPSFRAELQLRKRSKSVLGFGKGVAREQAYLSAAFEAVERLCSTPNRSVAILRASWKEVREQALDVQKRIGTVYFYRNNEPFTENTPIDWVWGRSLYDGNPVLIPASMVYVGGTGFAGKFYNSSTGGIAAGTSLEDAVLQGLMEAIEHDSWMVWQANGIAGPEIRRESIEDPSISRILGAMEERGFQVRIRVLTTDLGIPVFRVWLVQPNSVEVYAAHGFGCHLNKYLALKRAVTEAKLAMPQTLYSRTANTHYMSQGNTDVLNSHHSLFFLHHFTRVDLAESGPTLAMNDVLDLTTGSVAGDTHKTLNILREHIDGVQVVAVNLTDPEIGIPVVRVVVVGLQPLSHPLQAIQDRLFEVPCRLGLREKPLQFHELFNGRYPF